MRQIILASQSPRRKELLTKMGVTFTAIPSDYDEQLDDSRPPEEVAKELGLGKALAVARGHPDAIVIGSDVIVAVGGRQLGKAADIDEARALLKFVTEQPNQVITSFAVVCLDENIQIVDAAIARVGFRPYNKDNVEAYLRTGDWKDKAAAYGVQSGADLLVDYIEGDFDVIVGLPTHVLAPILQKLGVSAHAVELEPPAGLIVK